MDSSLGDRDELVQAGHVVDPPPQRDLVTAGEEFLAEGMRGRHDPRRLPGDRRQAQSAVGRLIGPDLIHKRLLPQVSTEVLNEQLVDVSGECVERRRAVWTEVEVWAVP